MKQKTSVQNIITKGPEFTNDTPLDHFFHDLDTNFLQKVNKYDHEGKNSSIDLYQYLNFKDNSEFVTYMLSLLKKLCILVHENEEHQMTLDGDANKLLPISLHDMKFLDQLSTLIIIHGIDANMTQDFRIPAELRKVNSYKDEDKKYSVPYSHMMNDTTLAHVVQTLYNIIKPSGIQPKEDYLRSIILKGPLYTNLYLGLLSMVVKNPNLEIYKTQLNTVEESQETYSLYVMYTLLTQSIRNSECKAFVLNKLSTLHIRREKDGLISLVDFILGVREEEQIDMEKMNNVNKVVIAKPKSIPNAVYLSKLFEQVYDGLTYINRPILVNCLNGIISEFFYKNKRIVKDFLFKRIYEVLFNVPLKDHTSKELNDTINVLISLSKNISTELIIELTSGLDENGFFLNLWIYCLFLKKNQTLDPLVVNKLKKEDNSPYFEVILSLIQTLVIITDKFSILDEISLHLLNFDHDEWQYKINLETQLPFISLKDKSVDENIMSSLVNKETKVDEMSKLFVNMDIAVDLFIELLKLLNNDSKITDIFLLILSRWIQNTATADKNRIKANNDDMSKNLLIIVDLKILQKMNEGFKTDLINNKKDVLIMIEKLLGFIDNQNDEDEDEEEHDQTEPDSDDEVDYQDDDLNEVTNNFDTKITSSSSTLTALHTILELLQLILSDMNARDNIEMKSLLESIDLKLCCYAEHSQLANNLQEKIKKLLNENKSLTDEFGDIKIDDDLELDQEILNRALVNISDILVPIKAHGFTELRKLVEKKSKAISIDRVVNIYLQHLKNPDPFIYLNIIKGLFTFTQLQPKETLTKLIEFYKDPSHKNKLDDILKVGEVFVNYIQYENTLFSGEYADKIIDMCLEKIRGYDKVDNRIRMSSMSILGVCLQVNALGIQSRIREMFDCVFGILQLETNAKNKAEEEKQEEKKKTLSRLSTNKGQPSSFVMRRSAIHLVHDLLYNSGLSLLPSEYDATKLQTLLEYVKSNDDDYLVCEQIEQLLSIIKELSQQGFENVLD